MGLYENEPKVYTNEQGQPAGLFVDLLEQIAIREGWHLRYQHCEWSACLTALQQGELDLMPDVAFSVTRDEIMDFHSVAVAQSWSQLFSRRQETIRSFEDLAGKRVALLEGSVQQAVIAELMAERNLDYEPILVPSMEDVFRQVQLRKADVAVTNSFFARRHLPDYNLTATPVTFNQVGLYYATAEGRHGQLLDTIDAYLTRWQADPESVYYQALRRSATQPADKVVPGWAVNLLWVTCAALVGLAIVISLLRWTVKQRSRALQATNQRLQHVLNGSPAIIYSLRGKDLKPIWVSSNIERIFGFSQAMALEQGWWRRQLHPDDRVSALRNHHRIFDLGHLNHEYRLFDARGKVRYVHDEMQLLPGKGTEEDEIIGTLTDQTETHEQKARLSYLTHYDPLTGLPNRMSLHKQLAEAIKEANEETQTFCLICIDLDRFKNINDSLGPSTGDKVLEILVQRLRKLLYRSEILSRTGADEFCLIVRSCTQVDIDNRLGKIINAFKDPLTVGDQSLILTASIGLSQFPKDGETPEQLMTTSELAMFAAKKRGGDCTQAYYTKLSQVTEENFLLENALRHAIVNRELLLHFQPQFNLQTGALIGVEALVRWRHPTQGLISPGQFIPLAEEIGVIADIDRWVLNAACEQLLEWDIQGFYVPRVAVNLSVSELENDSLLERVESTLNKTGLNPQRLELEITESMLMRAPDNAIPLLNRLSSKGVQLAMDDFGTGYSNLSHLGSLPIDSLKIDQSFIRDIGDAPHNESIVRAIIALADALRLQIVAEGIEQPHQQAFLRQAGCTVGQGYLLGHPMEAAELRRQLAGLTVDTLNQRTAT